MGIGRIRVVEDKAIVEAVIKNWLRAVGFSIANHDSTAQMYYLGAEKLHPDYILLDITWERSDFEFWKG